jgi:hypothetical protein
MTAKCQPPTPTVSLPGDHVGCKAHEEGPNEGADLLGGTLSSTLLFLQTALPHTARERGEKVTLDGLARSQCVLLRNTDSGASLGQRDLGSSFGCNT